MRRLGFLLTATFLILSCRNPLHELDPHLATVRIRASIPGYEGSRTVTADFSSLFDTLTVSLKSDDHPSPADKVIPSDASQVAFTVPAGTWDITVVATKAGVEVGSGVRNDVQLGGGLTAPVDVHIVFGPSSGTGDVSFTVSVTPGTSDVDFVHGRLIESPFTEVDVPLTAAAGKRTGTLAFSGLPARTYSLEMTFRRGGATGTVAGIFREKLIVTAGFMSGKWVDANGNLVDERAFAAEEFYSPDAALGSLTITAGTSVTVPLDSEHLSYFLDPIAGLTETGLFMATAVPGQYLEYAFNDPTFNDSSFVVLQPGSPVALSGISTTGSNTLALRVTAADRATKNTYWIYFSVSAGAGGGSYPVSGGTVTFSVSGGEITVGKYSGSASEVVIPSSIGGLPVTALSDTFYDCTGLTSVVIPDSVETVEGNTFYHCFNLTSVTLPSVTSIGPQSFSDCRNLTSVTMPNVTSIGSDAFYHCVGLTSVTMPNVTSIGSDAFSYCVGLTSVTMPNVTSISNRAFDSCVGLTSVTMPNVTSIDSEAFYNCTKLESATLPSVTSIGPHAFDQCLNLTSATMPLVISIGDYAFRACSKLISATMPDVTSIGSDAFDGCTNLTSATMPSVTSIGPHAFDGCSNLTSATMPSVNSIGYDAFKSCSKLPSVTIPASVTIIDFNAFSNCYSLGVVTVLATDPPSLSQDAFKNDDPDHPVTITDIVVPPGCAEAYKAVWAWSQYAAWIHE